MAFGSQCHLTNHAPGEQIFYGVATAVGTFVACSTTGARRKPAARRTTIKIIKINDKIQAERFFLFMNRRRLGLFGNGGFVDIKITFFSKNFDAIVILHPDK